MSYLLRNEPRATWQISHIKNNSGWYAIYSPYPAIDILLLHGQQFKGGGFGMPWYSIQKKAGGWSMGAIPEHWTYCIFGHWHTPVMMDLSDKMFIGNGSTESTNEFAQESIGASGQPRQWILYFHPRRGLSATYRGSLERSLIKAPMEYITGTEPYEPVPVPRL
jgi:hypothetical protein